MKLAEKPRKDHQTVTLENVEILKRKVQHVLDLKPADRRDASVSKFIEAVAGRNLNAHGLAREWEAAVSSGTTIAPGDQTKMKHHFMEVLSAIAPTDISIQAAAFLDELQARFRIVERRGAC
ncbi:MAG: hypothetical protein KGH94_05465 [Candidatus Micrarchaeota archaeon]|nr:hypothetical protein [Candidatus Micrarchaeota archaeon]